MSLNDSSDKDSDLLKKKIGSEMKVYIKKASGDYLENLKAEVMKGFKSYYDELNTNVQTELNSQETQQKDLHDKLDQRGAKIAQLKEKVLSRIKVEIAEKELKIDLLRKLKIISMLMTNVINKKAKRKKNSLILQLARKNKIKKIFNVFKNLSIYMPTNKYIEKMKAESKRKFEEFKVNQNNQKQDMIKLINQAKEKLKHENRKKVQVKLLLDQMILRGISSLNMQAISLSQNSLNDVVNCNYKKAIDTKYDQMLLPQTKGEMKKRINSVSYNNFKDTTSSNFASTKLAKTGTNFKGTLKSFNS